MENKRTEKKIRSFIVSGEQIEKKRQLLRTNSQKGEKRSSLDQIGLKKTANLLNINFKPSESENNSLSAIESKSSLKGNSKKSIKENNSLSAIESKSSLKGNSKKSLKGNSKNSIKENNSLSAIESKSSLKGNSKKSLKENASSGDIKESDSLTIATDIKNKKRVANKPPVFQTKQSLLDLNSIEINKQETIDINNTIKNKKKEFTLAILHDEESSEKIINTKNDDKDDKDSKYDSDDNEEKNPTSDEEEEEPTHNEDYFSNKKTSKTNLNSFSSKKSSLKRPSNIAVSPMRLQTSKFRNSAMHPHSASQFSRSLSRLNMNMSMSLLDMQEEEIETLAANTLGVMNNGEFVYDLFYDFEKVKSFQNYFPHNNIENVLKSIKQNKKATATKPIKRIKARFTFQRLVHKTIQNLKKFKNNKKSPKKSPKNEKFNDIFDRDKKKKKKSKTIVNMEKSSTMKSRKQSIGKRMLTLGNKKL